MESQEKISSFQSFQLTPRFFATCGANVILFALGFAMPFIIPIAKLLLLAIVVLLIAEWILLYFGSVEIYGKRTMSKMLSLGDDNKITLAVKNKSRVKLKITLYDEIPFQFQLRDFKLQLEIKPSEMREFEYHLRPSKRGVYSFGYTNAITSILFGLAARRIQICTEQQVPVYPSIIQMKKYELLAFSKISKYEGIKKIRRLGHSYEFEQIKQYVIGDDVRSINWKATSRRDQLMVNQYEDERSQQIYTIIDKSRNMHMPFNGLSLLDYAINSSLVISNIALKKYDRTGLITFSHKIGTTLPAERSELQLKKILNSLYHEKPQPLEADYDLLYRAVKNVIHGRSLLFLYLNFESTYALERALPVIQKINHQHLLVVMIFENTELIEYSKKAPAYVSDIYANTIAGKLLNEKKEIVAILRKHGIQTILSRPEDLSINTVNKYLELKSRGLI
jgi:uncharacterized protein (DUF58 family)